MHPRFFLTILPTLLSIVVPSLCLPVQPSDLVSVEARSLDLSSDSQAVFSRDVADDSSLFEREDVKFEILACADDKDIFRRATPRPKVSKAAQTARKNAVRARVAHNQAANAGKKAALIAANQPSLLSSVRSQHQTIRNTRKMPRDALSAAGARRLVGKNTILQNSPRRLSRTWRRTSTKPTRRLWPRKLLQMPGSKPRRQQQLHTMLPSTPFTRKLERTETCPRGLIGFACQTMICSLEKMLARAPITSRSRKSMVAGRINTPALSKIDFKGHPVNKNSLFRLCLVKVLNILSTKSAMGFLSLRLKKSLGPLVLFTRKMPQEDIISKALLLTMSPRSRASQATTTTT
ncbi:hypothetical protein BDN70DRAFT_444435 [Pholiota conissans]|uniref:Uncharacterized protein n=1 Tax=Pholiota conissans TaxID=109636 RepID=A0A9P5Z7M0_9AGAR|nr:hypothetical protein BDN70DRAFT_444435 [Pholiota conissans]